MDVYSMSLGMAKVIGAMASFPWADISASELCYWALHGVYVYTSSFVCIMPNAVMKTCASYHLFGENAFLTLR